MKKKLIGIILSIGVISALAFAGCGKNDTSKATEAPTTEAVTTETPTTEEPTTEEPTTEEPTTEEPTTEEPTTEEPTTEAPAPEAPAQDIVQYDNAPVVIVKDVQILWDSSMFEDGSTMSKTYNGKTTIDGVEVTNKAEVLAALGTKYGTPIEDEKPGEGSIVMCPFYNGCEMIFDFDVWSSDLSLNFVFIHASK